MSAHLDSSSLAASLGVAERSFRITGIDRSNYMAKDPLHRTGTARKFELGDGSMFGLWVGSDFGVQFQLSNGVLFAVKISAPPWRASKQRAEFLSFRGMRARFCRMALIHDTQGNVVTLHQRKTAT